MGAHNVNDSWEREAEVTSPAYEHAPPEHPDGSPEPPAHDQADAPEPTETKTH